MRALPGAILILAGAMLIAASLIAAQLRAQQGSGANFCIFGFVLGAVIGLIGFLFFLFGFLWEVAENPPDFG